MTDDDLKAYAQTLQNGYSLTLTKQTVLLAEVRRLRDCILEVADSMDLLEPDRLPEWWVPKEEENG